MPALTGDHCPFMHLDHLLFDLLVLFVRNHELCGEVKGSVPKLVLSVDRNAVLNEGRNDSAVAMKDTCVNRGVSSRISQICLSTQ